jgi:hypothetical protein
MRVRVATMVTVVTPPRIPQGPASTRALEQKYAPRVIYKRNNDGPTETRNLKQLTEEFEAELAGKAGGGGGGGAPKSDASNLRPLPRTRRGVGRRGRVCRPKA